MTSYTGNGPSSPAYIGAKIRARRTALGKTQAAVAGLAGISKSFLSELENGHKSISRRRDLDELCRALDVRPEDLGIRGPHLPPAPGRSPAHAAYQPVMLAFLATSLDAETGPAPRSPHQLWAATTDLMERRQRAEYEGVGRLLPALVRDTHNAYVVAARGSTTAEADLALESLIMQCHCAVMWLKNLGYLEAAWIAGDRGHQAAVRRGDPTWLGLAKYARAQAMIGLGGYAEAGADAARAVAQIPRQTERELSVVGELVLITAFSDIVTGAGDGAAAVEEASSMAATMGSPNHFYLNFSGTCIELWKLDFENERGEQGRAVEIGEAVNPSDIPARTRQAHYYAGYGVALAGIGRNADAVHAFVTGESIAPDRIRNNTAVRDATAVILTGAQRTAGGPELAGLAHRIGLDQDL